MTQRDRVLKYLQEHDEITPLDAFRELGITKLATVVSGMIREEGMDITKEWKEVKNRYGETCRVMSYSLGSKDYGSE